MWAFRRLPTEPAVAVYAHRLALPPLVGSDVTVGCRRTLGVRRFSSDLPPDFGHRAVLGRLPERLPKEETPVRTKSRLRTTVIWSVVALTGAAAWGVIALVRGEQISAAWLIAAALGSYAIAYRFYVRFIVRKVLGVDDQRSKAMASPGANPRTAGPVRSITLATPQAGISGKKHGNRSASPRRGSWRRRG